MSAPTPFYKHVLRRELERRLGSNPRYSLRAFARALAIDASVLSRVLSDKRVLSMRAAARVLARLTLSPSEHSVFLQSVAEEQKKHAPVRSEPVSTARPASEPAEADAEAARIAFNLNHNAILELSRTAGFVADARWIARRLAITALEAKDAIDRMLRLGLLRRGEGGRLQKTRDKVTLPDTAVATPALREHQLEILQRAARSLDHDPAEVRSLSGATMAIDPDKLPLAREMIGEFILQLSDVLGGGQRSRVYQLGVSLFPLDKPAAVATAAPQAIEAGSPPQAQLGCGTGGTSRP